MKCEKAMQTFRPTKLAHRDLRMAVDMAQRITRCPLVLFAEGGQSMG
jgi:hypothetical protein